MNRRVVNRAARYQQYSQHHIQCGIRNSLESSGAPDAVQLVSLGASVPATDVRAKCLAVRVSVFNFARL